MNPQPFPHRQGCASEDYRDFLHRIDSTPSRRCLDCGSAAPIAWLEGRAAFQDRDPYAGAKYALDCVRCGFTIRLFRPRPRVPLCSRCKTTKAKTPAREDQLQ